VRLVRSFSLLPQRPRIIRVHHNSAPNRGDNDLLAQPKASESRTRLVIHDLSRRNGHANFAADVLSGLSATPKHLFAKYLYDALGSQLFEAICRVDEYYLTRAENEILSRRADEIVSSIVGCETLVELGSGSAEKTRQIIEALLRQRAELLFVPVDISASALEKSSRSLLESYPSLRIRAYAADYFEGLATLKSFDARPMLVLFLGSNIGNFEKDEAENFLRAIRGVLKSGDALLLGVDLKKDRATLEAAYNDALGVTRAFIVNELARINRELGGNFDLWAFGLRSVYNEAAGCVEVYLESLRSQSVEIRQLNLTLSFAAGERMHMENAYKYDLSELSTLAAQSGFQLTRTWLDEQQRFSSNLFVVA
jgi:L-histidine N-alpha-methyltransferase